MIVIIGHERSNSPKDAQTSDTTSETLHIIVIVIKSALRMSFIVDFLRRLFFFLLSLVARRRWDIAKIAHQEAMSCQQSVVPNRIERKSVFLWDIEESYVLPTCHCLPSTSSIKHNYSLPTNTGDNFNRFHCCAASYSLVAPIKDFIARHSSLELSSEWHSKHLDVFVGLQQTNCLDGISPLFWQTTSQHSVWNQQEESVFGYLFRHWLNEFSDTTHSTWIILVFNSQSSADVWIRFTWHTIDTTLQRCETRWMGFGFEQKPNNINYVFTPVFGRHQNTFVLERIMCKALIVTCSNQ